jgi:hypothetical protein
MLRAWQVISTRIDRQGFPLQAASDIIYLSTVHEHKKASGDTYHLGTVIKR